MALIYRELQPLVEKQTPPKAVVVFGPRRVGKTTLLREIAKVTTVSWYNGDNPEDIDRLELRSSGDVLTVLHQADTLVIDEAQRFPNIGLTLKRLVDANETETKPTRIFVTGSSSLDLAKGVKESAVGRLVMRQMWPLSITELAADRGWGEVSQKIDQLMVYGLYPSIVTSPEDARMTLQDYVDGILFKDLFALSGIRHNTKFEHLVRLLAFNVGSEVSYEGLARDTGLNKTTVMDYITLLEQCFIVKVCGSFSRNLSNELKKGKKVYFCDNGIRNAIIGNFSPMSARDDAGALWENFFFMERVKLHDKRQDFTQLYFWRTTGRTQHELDFIEVTDGVMKAYECKVNPKAKAKPGDEFLAAYPGCEIQVVSPRDLMKIWAPVR